MRERYGTARDAGDGRDRRRASTAISRADQDAFALRSQERAAKAIADGRLAREIEPVPVPQRRGEPVLVATDEHPRATSLEALAALRPLFPGGTVTAGNSSGINDGAAALLVASEARRARATGWSRWRGSTAGAVAGVAPQVMGIGPVPATRKLLDRTGLTIGDLDVVELNEAFAAQALAVLRRLGLPDDAEHVNPNGGAIALGHPLGASGARLALTAALELRDRGATPGARHHVHRRGAGHRGPARGRLIASCRSTPQRSKAGIHRWNDSGDHHDRHGARLPRPRRPVLGRGAGAAGPRARVRRRADPPEHRRLVRRPRTSRASWSRRWPRSACSACTCTGYGCAGPLGGRVRPGGDGAGGRRLRHPHVRLACRARWR